MSTSSLVSDTCHYCLCACCCAVDNLPVDSSQGGPNVHRLVVPTALVGNLPPTLSEKDVLLLFKDKGLKVWEASRLSVNGGLVECHILKKHA